MPADATLAEGAFGGGVSRDRDGFVIVIGEYRLCAQRTRKARNFVLSHGVAHDDVLAVRRELALQLRYGVPDEFDTPIFARERIQDSAIEYEYRQHPLGLG
jgi:hypothetical protein